MGICQGGDGAISSKEPISPGPSVSGSTPEDWGQSIILRIRVLNYRKNFALKVAIQCED